MNEERPSLAERLDSFRGAIGRLDDLLALRTLQERARARWWKETHEPPPPALSIADRLAGLTPRRSRIERAGRRGRILLTTEPVEAGEVVLAEPALVRLAVRDEGDPTPDPWRMVAAIVELAEPDRSVVLDLHDAHAGRRETFAALAGRLAAEGLRTGPDPAEAARILGISRTNAFGPCGGWVMSIYPAIAMAAHSCNPSCERANADGILFVQAGRDLAEGEEVTISYVDTTLPAFSRLVALRARYGFECDCPRCVDAVAHGEVDLDEVRVQAERLRDEYLVVVGGPAPAGEPERP